MQIVFTRIPSAAYSLARDLVRLMPAARDSVVGRARAVGALPPTTVTLTICPPPRRFMCGMARRQKRTAPITLRSKSACQVASSTASNAFALEAVSYTHLRAHETPEHLV